MALALKFEGPMGPLGPVRRDHWGAMAFFVLKCGVLCAVWLVLIPQPCVSMRGSDINIVENPLAAGRAACLTG